MLGVILAALVMIVGGRKNNRYMVTYKSEFSQSKRIAYAVRVFPFPAVAMLCVVQAISALMY